MRDDDLKARVTAALDGDRKAFDAVVRTVTDLLDVAAMYRTSPELVAPHDLVSVIKARLDGE